tara:strand:- start:333 stop:1157 length:825 start_codon:yes stop_codon:yes gene_type:complete
MIYVQLTNGFGNNLFQANAGKILANHNNDSVKLIQPCSGYYAKPELEKLNFVFAERPPSFTHSFQDDNYISAFSIDTKNNKVLLSGYFEDHRYFTPNRDKIKSWYPAVENKERTLAIHLRTGDRLFYKNEFYSKPSAKSYEKAIQKFEFDRIHVVSDFPIWKQISEKELESYVFHYKVPKKDRVPIGESVRYFNSLQKMLSDYGAIFEKRSIVEDFNFIRSCDNILFEHGTLSWWASFLSDARKVGVYGPWRPWKGTSNKNLSQTPLDGWFRWE